MITSIAQSIASLLLRNKIVDGKKLDIYIYGFEVMISNTINVTLGLLFGFIFSQLLEMIVFITIFVLLRSYCGGYHAATYLKCNIIFALNIVVVMLILRFITVLPLFTHLVIVAGCLLTVVMLAPIDNKNKPLMRKEKKAHKIKAILLTAVISGIALVLLTVSEYYSFVIDIALLTIAVSMIIEKLRKGEMSYEKGNA